LSNSTGEKARCARMPLCLPEGLECVEAVLATGCLLSCGREHSAIDPAKEKAALDVT
jgi:hypothetical protein